MAVVLDPNEIRPFWLKDDASKPEATRPIFECIAGNARIRRQHRALMEKATKQRAEIYRLRDENKVDELKIAEPAFWDTITEALFMGVVGWRNINKPFEKTLDAFREVVEEDTDIIELAGDWTIAGKLTDGDVKNSQSPRDTGAEKSAPDAVA